ncbi:MAG: patatin-like phospholipase family protein [Prevotella sp.]|nr:patatin-like phospholipase family protein [Prevotella sp.]
MKIFSFSQIQIILLTLLFALSLTACRNNNNTVSQPISEKAPGKTRPKIGLVLGGGGAKGSAEIGVLKKLEKMGIQVDYIAGSSMGAVIGSLYAAGIPAESIEQFMLKKKWMKLFDKNKINITKGIITGEEQDHSNIGLVVRPYLQRELDRVLSDKKCHLFENLKIPFRCTATIVEESGKFKAYTCEEGVVATGVVASMSHPCFIFPWKHENMNLYDGGILNNLPVNLVKDMGADIIIAVDIENSKKIRTDEFAYFLQNSDYAFLYTEIKGKIKKHIKYSEPIINWLEHRPDIEIRENFIKEAENNDSFIYIHIDLDDKSVADFTIGNINDMIKRGEKAAEEHRAELERVLKAIK